MKCATIHTADCVLLNESRSSFAFLGECLAIEEGGSGNGSGGNGADVGGPGGQH